MSSTDFKRMRHSIRSAKRQGTRDRAALHAFVRGFVSEAFAIGKRHDVSCPTSLTELRRLGTRRARSGRQARF